MQALVFNGVVKEISETQFPVHEGFKWVECDETVEVGTQYDGTGFVPKPPPPAITPDQIKTEAQRRIFEIMPAWKQTNTIAMAVQATTQYGADIPSWPNVLQAKVALANTAWGLIEATREKSDQIEAMDPIPTDFTADKWWNA